MSLSRIKGWSGMSVFWLQVQFSFTSHCQSSSLIDVSCRDDFIQREKQRIPPAQKNTHRVDVFKSPLQFKTNIILTDVERRYVDQKYITSWDTFMVASSNDVGIYILSISIKHHSQRQAISRYTYSINTTALGHTQATDKLHHQKSITQSLDAQ